MKASTRGTSCLPLCFRCHHRAAFLESGGSHRPRFECGEAGRAVCGCYMYRPPRPLLLRPVAGDRRPIGAPAMIAARLRAVGEAPGQWRLQRTRGGWLMQWREGKEMNRLGRAFRIREAWQRLTVSLGCAALWLFAGLAGIFLGKQGREP